MRLLERGRPNSLLDRRAGTACTALALVALLLAGIAPAQANWVAGTSDYAWIDSPPDNAYVYGPTVLTGRAGNNFSNAVPPGGSDADPIRSDAQGDGGPGADVGNVWVTNDTGSRFQINLRLHDEGPLTGANPVAETPYMVEFTHNGTGVRYGVGASKFTGPGYDGLYAGEGIEYVLWVETLATDWCRYQPLFGNLTAGVLTWDIPYAVLDIAGAPDAPFLDLAFVGFLLTPYDDCDPGWTTGPAAVVGDVLHSFQARFWPQVGPGEFFLDREPGLGDTSDGPINHTYTLGSLPPGIGPGSSGPSGPFTPVNLTVNGVPAATFATNANGAWNRTIDFSLFTPVNGRFTVNVTYRSAWDVAVYRLGAAPFPRAGAGSPGTEPVPDPVMEGAGSPSDADLAALDEQARWEAAGGAGGCTGTDGDGDRTPDGCDGDRDGDGLKNGVDNCPRITNPDQRDTDHNGVGDACDADADGDGFSDGLDLCPRTADGQHDLDRDGIGDACDPDRDGDGVPDESDLFPADGLESRDQDGDGIGDGRDADVDGDGFGNAAERAAGTDPFDAASRPTALQGTAHALEMPSMAASVAGLGLVGIVAAFLVLGLLLVPLARRSK